MCIYVCTHEKTMLRCGGQKGEGRRDRVLASKRGLNLRRLVCSRSCCCDLGEIVRIRLTPWSLFDFPPSENGGAEGVVLVYLLISRNPSPPLRDAQTTPQFLRSWIKCHWGRKEWEESLEFFLPFLRILFCWISARLDRSLKNNEKWW